MCSAACRPSPFVPSSPRTTGPAGGRLTYGRLQPTEDCRATGRPCPQARPRSGRSWLTTSRPAAAASHRPWAIPLQPSDRSCRTHVLPRLPTVSPCAGFPRTTGPAGGRLTSGRHATCGGLPRDRTSLPKGKAPVWSIMVDDQPSRRRREPPPVGNPAPAVGPLLPHPCAPPPADRLPLCRAPRGRPAQLTAGSPLAAMQPAGDCRAPGVSAHWQRSDPVAHG